MAGKETIYRSDINSCIHRMKPQVSCVHTLKQGSSDPLSNWSTARKTWVNQLLLRLRVFTWEVTSLGQPLPCFEIDKLGPPLSTAQIVYFDKIHKQCIIGKSGGVKKDIKFH